MQLTAMIDGIDVVKVAVIAVIVGLTVTAESTLDVMPTVMIGEMIGRIDVTIVAVSVVLTVVVVVTRVVV